LDSRLNVTFILAWPYDIINLRRAPEAVVIRLKKDWWFYAF